MAEVALIDAIKNVIRVILNDYVAIHGIGQIRNEDVRVAAFNAAKAILEELPGDNAQPVNINARDTANTVASTAASAVARAAAVAALKEATKNVGKQLVKAHFREGGKVFVKAYFRRVAARGGASMMPGIGQIMFAVNAADTAYTLWTLYKNKEAIKEVGKLAYNWWHNIEDDDINDADINNIINNIIDETIEEMIRDRPVLLIEYFPPNVDDDIANFEREMNLLRYENHAQLVRR